MAIGDNEDKTMGVVVMYVNLMAATQHPTGKLCRVAGRPITITGKPCHHSPIHRGSARPQMTGIKQRGGEMGWITKVKTISLQL